MLIGGFVSVVGGLIVAFTGSWKLTLVMLAFMPMLMIGGMLANKLLVDIVKNGNSSESISSAGQVRFYTLLKTQSQVCKPGSVLRNSTKT